MDRTDGVDLRARAVRINEGIPSSGLYGTPESGVDGSKVPWRLSPEPFPMLPATVAQLDDLGNHLLAFYRAANKLYMASVRGIQPTWITGYLDQGKPEQVVELGRLRRFRAVVPAVIRPDLMAVSSGKFIATELDSVPGGIGVLDYLMVRYQELDGNLVGHEQGAVASMARALMGLVEVANPVVAVVVSDESESYRAEMTWVAERLNEFGVRATAVHPRQLDLSNGDIVVEFDGKLEKVDVIYRFFELHDLKNIPNFDLIIHAMKKRRVLVTPPIKAYLEEKLLYALFHHPELATFWLDELSEKSFSVLQETIPKTWIMDPAQIPPHATITPSLNTSGRQIRRWNELYDLTQREREIVIKPSGFSDLAWGSRGVTVGHDTNAETWAMAIEEALSGFQKTPFVLQQYHPSQRVTSSYYDFEAESVTAFDARTRISPYYFIRDGVAELAGVLVTACPSASKLLHGMTDAVMVPARSDPTGVI